MNVLQKPRLTATGVAKRLGVTTKTVKKWDEEGKLPKKITLADNEYWLVEDIDDWVQQQNPHLFANSDKEFKGVANA